MADEACRAVGVVGADCRRNTVVAENEILLVENEWNFGIEDAELFNIGQKRWGIDRDVENRLGGAGGGAGERDWRRGEERDC